MQRLRRSDGVYRWFQNSGFPLRDTSGHIVRWCVLLTDIDERKRAEDALRESERESRLIVDSIPGLVAAFTPGGEVEFVNRQILEYFGRTLEELKRWGTGGMTHPEDLPRVVELFTHSIASGDPFEFEVRARRFDGVYRWFQSRGFPLRDTNGHIVRWYNLLIDIDERKRAEEALATNERNLKLIIDTIPALAWSARTDGAVDFFNQHYLEFVGLPAEQALGWGWTAAIHPDDLNGLTAIWQQVLSSEQPGEAEARLRRHDGEYRWFLVRAKPLRDETGRVFKWYGVNIDIEDRKRTEEELRRSEAFLAQGQRLTLTGSLWWEVSTGEVIWSEETFRIMDVPKSTKPTVELALSRVHPEDVALARQMVERSARDGVNMDFELRLLMSDGSVKHVHVVLSQNIGRQPDKPEFVGALTDITERKRAEAELRRAYNHLTEAQRLSQTGSFTADLERDEHYWSDEFYRICEFDQDPRFRSKTVKSGDVPPRGRAVVRGRDRTGDGWHEPRLLFPHRDLARRREAFARLRAPDRGSAGVRRRDSGRHRQQDGPGGAEQGGRRARTCVEADDHERADRLDCPRGEPAAFGHHHQRRDVSPDVGRDAAGLDGARETARRTIRDGNRASDVITRLRALFSKREFTLEQLDLNEATREVIALASSDLQRHRVILHSDLSDGLPIITGDRIQLQQVIANLLRNAADAMTDVHDRPRELLIRTEQDGERVRLTVRDAGVGLPPQSVASLFDAFYTTKSGGMGIGLFVSRSIIERHHGQLWAQSNNDGPGATFSVFHSHRSSERFSTNTSIMGCRAQVGDNRYQSLIDRRTARIHPVPRRW